MIGDISLVLNHFCPYIEGFLWFGKVTHVDWRSTYANHHCVEYDVRNWVCNVSHVSKEVPGLCA